MNNNIKKLQIFLNATYVVVIYLYITYYMMITISNLLKLIQNYSVLNSPILLMSYYIILIGLIVLFYIRKFSYQTLVIILLLINVFY